jgi:hypothetical protein
MARQSRIGTSRSARDASRAAISAIRRLRATHCACLVKADCKRRITERYDAWLGCWGGGSAPVAAVESHLTEGQAEFDDLSPPHDEPVGTARGLHAEEWDSEQ